MADKCNRLVVIQYIVTLRECLVDNLKLNALYNITRNRLFVKWCYSTVLAVLTPIEVT